MSGHIPRVSVRFTSQVWEALLRYKQDRGLPTWAAAVRGAVIDALAAPGTDAEIRGWRAGYEQGLAEGREANYKGAQAYTVAVEKALGGTE